jgi:hypothetical protein
LLIHWAISGINQPATGSRLALSITHIEHIKELARIMGLIFGGSDSSLRLAPTLGSPIGPVSASMDFQVAVQALGRDHARAKPACLADVGLSARQPTQVQAEGAQAVIGCSPLSEA